MYKFIENLTNSKRALIVAAQWHAGQYRDSGEAYIIHP